MPKASNPKVHTDKERIGFSVSQADKIQVQRGLVWAFRHTGYEA